MANGKKRRQSERESQWQSNCLPLYREAVAQPPTLDSSGHAGLWYDKFCNQWRVNTHNRCWSLSAEEKEKERENPKLAWIKTVTGGRGHSDLLEEYKTRLVRFAHTRNGRYWVIKTASRFVTGMGRPHPVENGFAWHHTLGTPYLPGSSLKGLLRAAAEDLGAERGLIDRLLGNEQKKTAGALSVLDMLPLKPVQLEADVMTPHYANWTADDLPGDWRSPTPIPFLTVAADQSFLAIVVPRGNGNSVAVSDEDWQAVERWLEHGLRLLGAGAKTAVGYGRMEIDQQETPKLREQFQQQLEEERRRQQEQERLAQMDPLERELEEIKRGITDPNKRPWLAWLDELDKGRWRQDRELERRVAQRIKEEMERENRWRPVSKKKNPEKDHDHQRTLQVMRYLS